MDPVVQATEVSNKTYQIGVLRVSLDRDLAGLDRANPIF